MPPHRKNRCVLVAAPASISHQVRIYYDGIERYCTQKRPDWTVRYALSKSFFDINLPTLDRELASGLDGIILGMRPPPDTLERVCRAGLKVVIIDPAQPVPDQFRSGNLATVQVDERRLAKTAVDFMLRTERYASHAFCFSNDFWFGEVDSGGKAPRWRSQRQDAIIAELARRGHSCTVLELPKDKDRLLALPKPAAIFAANDPMACAVSEACFYNGIRIPQEVALLGVDNEPFLCQHAQPTLSSVAPDFELAGYTAARLMDALLHNRRVKSTTTYGIREVVERLSTAASSPAGRLAAKADDLIRRHARQGLKVEDLARMMGISKRLLTLRYRQIKRTTVLQAIHAARLAEVVKLLDSTNCPIGEIASICGFADGAPLKRLFKAHYGVTMRDWRTGARHPSLCGISLK